MHTNQLQLHERDRMEHAKRLAISLEKFDALVTSANNAYEIIKNFGPFYGKGDSTEPTFRTTAEPIILASTVKHELETLGNDLLVLAQTLKILPDNYKKLLGDDLDYRIPPTWRIDAILTEDGSFKINEIEGKDGASALMIAEQLAFGLQKLQESTAAKLVPTLKAMSSARHNGVYKIALIRTHNYCSPNADRFINFLHILSEDTLKIDHFHDDAIVNNDVKPNWESYAAVINEGSLSPKQLIEKGIYEDQIIASGNYNALVNKGVFAILFDSQLAEFWVNQLGKERFTRLKEKFIPSSFITNDLELLRARNEGKLVKVSWAGTNTNLINLSRGVALPIGSLEHSSDERWLTLGAYLKQKVSIIEQDFVMPKKIGTYLRRKGITIEPIEWYNRLCIKYVVSGNPNTDADSHVDMTATEVTLGPDIIPAGRACAFTAGAFE